MTLFNKYLYPVLTLVFLTFALVAGGILLKQNQDLRNKAQALTCSQQGGSCGSCNKPPADKPGATNGPDGYCGCVGENGANYWNTTCNMPSGGGTTPSAGGSCGAVPNGGIAYDQSSRCNYSCNNGTWGSAIAGSCLPVGTAPAQTPPGVWLTNGSSGQVVAAPGQWTSNGTNATPNNVTTAPTGRGGTCNITNESSTSFTVNGPCYIGDFTGNSKTDCPVGPPTTYTTGGTYTVTAPSCGSRQIDWAETSGGSQGGGVCAHAANDCGSTPPTNTPRPTNTPTNTPTPTQVPSNTPSPTGTLVPSNSPTPTNTPGPTNTPATPTDSPNSCNGTCGSDNNCQSGLSCYLGFCRNPNNPSDSGCNNKGEPNHCNGTCGSDANCIQGLVCSSGYCRNPNNPTNINCQEKTVAKGPTPTRIILPVSGNTTPLTGITIVGSIVTLLGILLIL